MKDSTRKLRSYTFTGYLKSIKNSFNDMFFSQFSKLLKKKEKKTKTKWNYIL